MGAEGVLLRTVETGARFASTVVATCASKRRKLGSSVDSRSSHWFVYMPTQFCCLCALVELGQILCFHSATSRIAYAQLSNFVLNSSSSIGIYLRVVTSSCYRIPRFFFAQMMWKARFRIRRSWQWYIYLVELGPDVEIQVLSCSYMLFY